MSLLKRLQGTSSSLRRPCSPKGYEEAEEAEHAMKVLGASLWKSQDVSLFSGDERVNLFYRKDRATPSIYPRNYGAIKKKPL